MTERVERLSFHDEIKRNKMKSIILMIIIFIFFLILGSLIALILSPSSFFVILILAIILSLIYISASYFNSDKIALASVRAKPASRTEHRMLFHAVESMSLASGLPMPKVYVMESEQINAFASGRNPNNAVICVTTGTLKKLNKQELEGVIAHEMSHIGNYDIRFMTLTAILVGLIAIIAEIFVRTIRFAPHYGEEGKRGKIQLLIFAIAIIAAILAPIAAQLVSLAISRKKKFTTDATTS